MHRQNRTVAQENGVPRDESLPGLAALLDPGVAGRIIGDKLLRAGCELDRCRATYVRYKPGVSCVVAFEVDYRGPSGESGSALCYGKCHTAGDFDRASEKAASRGGVVRPALRPFAAVRDIRTMVYSFPNDAEMGGLEFIANPKKLQRVLHDYHALFPGDEWRISDKRIRVETVRYKPEKRAVVRVDTRAVHRRSGEKRKVRIYLRTYHNDRGCDLFRIMSRLQRVLEDCDAVSVPAPYAYLPDRRTLVIGNVEGLPLPATASDPAAVEQVAAAGRALARLNACPADSVQLRGGRDRLEDAIDTGRTIEEVVPEAAGRTAAVLEAFRERVDSLSDATPRFVHGDFYHEQVLVDGDQVTILDFDRSYAGDPVADVGNFCARLRFLDLGDADADRGRFEHRFVSAYQDSAGVEIGSDRLEFWTAFGLFQLAVSPFRGLQPGWKPAVTEVVDECRRILK